MINFLCDRVRNNWNVFALNLNGAVFFLRDRASTGFEHCNELKGGSNAFLPKL